jgi:acetyl-CoA synthetase
VEVVDSWWQTETGAAMMSQRPSNRHVPLVPCIAGKPFYGVKPVLVDHDGDVITGEGQGALCAVCEAEPWCSFLNPKP